MLNLVGWDTGRGSYKQSWDIYCITEAATVGRSSCQSWSCCSSCSQSRSRGRVMNYWDHADNSWSLSSFQIKSTSLTHTNRGCYILHHKDKILCWQAPFPLPQPEYSLCCTYSSLKGVKLSQPQLSSTVYDTVLLAWFGSTNLSGYSTTRWYKLRSLKQQYNQKRF